MPRRRNDPREWNPELLVDERTQSIRGRLQNPWKYIYSNVAPYSAEIFTHVALALIHHPERNSKNIRRADILQDTDFNPDVPLDSETVDGQCVTGMRCIRTIRRRFMPRNPNLDDELEQTCRFYAAEDDFEATLVTYYCHFVDGKVPYYVPDVLGIGFELFEGRVYIAYLPLSSHDCTSDRLLGVALNLLRTFHRHWYYIPSLSYLTYASLGTSEGYQKRVHHDLLVDKSCYQDLYITLKNKYAHFLIDNWAEATDPMKHVFEDLSLASFLLLLWEQQGGQGKQTKFVDVGCGNGVLVYILKMEGYEGYGFDVRRRKSWNIFPPEVQSQLHERILLPSFLTNSTMQGDEQIETGEFEEGTFIIANHADELTPYTPIVAALTPKCAGFLAVPCCEHDFTGAKVGGGFLKAGKKGGVVQTEGVGRYGMYCEWISEIAREMGWCVEREMLRIPSTRNVGIIGRQIVTTLGDTRTKALELIHSMGGYDGFVERARGLKDKIHRAH